MHLFYNVMAAGSSDKALNVKIPLDCLHSLICWLHLFSMLDLFLDRTFLLAEWLTTCSGDFGIGQTFQLKANWWYLLPKVKSEHSRENRAFRKTCVCHRKLCSFPILGRLSDEIDRDTNKPEIWTLYIMECVNMRRICVTQRTSIFLMTDVWGEKIIVDKRAIPSARETCGFLYTRVQKVHQSGSRPHGAANLQEPTTCHILVSCHKWAPNYLKRLLKSLSNYIIWVGLISSSTSTQTTDCKRLTIEADVLLNEASYI